MMSEPVRCVIVNIPGRGPRPSGGARIVPIEIKEELEKR